MSRLLFTSLLVFALNPGLHGEDVPKAERVPSPFTAKLVEPFYPPLKPVPTFKPPALAAPKWALQLSDGGLFKIADFATTESLDGEWNISGLANSDKPFPRDADLEKGWQTPEFDDSSWDRVSVPLDWYQKYPEFRDAKAPPYVKGWYRRKIPVPQSMDGRRVLLTFDVAGYQATLFVNGTPVGSHHGDFTPWTVDITKAVKFGAENILALRVLSDFGPKWGVPVASHVYGSQWSISNIKGGLWQSARISYESPLRIKRVLISPNLQQSSVDLDYVIVNDTGETKSITLRAAVFPADQVPQAGAVVNTDLGELRLPPGETTGKASLPLSRPVLWSPDNPHLYNLFLVLDAGGKPVGGRVERFGFRDFKVKGNAFFLNGEQIYLFGGNLPSVRFGGVGLTLDEEMAKVKNTLQDFRAQGYNIIRTAHAPVPPFILDLADELGVMIYDEWGWAFTDTLDPAKFEANNLVEMTEWVERDYNHASVVMWSCGNEVHYDKPEVRDQLNKAVAKVRELDRSGRPVSVFSGAAYSYGKEKLDTDFLDLHTYIGASLPWTQWANLVPGKMFKEFIYPTYGEGGKLKIPFVVWETIGFSWGEQTDPGFTSGDIQAYARHVENKNTWAQPNTIGYSGSLGVAASLDPERGLLFGRNLYGKRISEFIRRDIEHYQGFAPWFPAKLTPASTIWTQPVFCGLRGGNELPPRNIFAGQSYQVELYTVNSTAKVLSGISAKVTLMSTDGRERPLGEVPLNSIAAFSREQKQIPLAIPQNLSAGFYQLRIVISQGEEEISRNFYDVYVGSPGVLNDPVTTSKNVGLLAGGDSRTENILTALGIPFSFIKQTKDLGDYRVLIVPAASKPNPILEDANAVRDIKNWVRAGGSLLVLEQEYPGSDMFGHARIKKDNTYADVVLTGHPVFKGLARENFDTWDSSEQGLVMRYPFADFSINAVATRGAYPKDIGVPTAVSEGKFGAGRIIESQLSAVDLWGVDSSASLYLRNLIAYMAGEEKAYAKAQPWAEPSSDYKVATDAVEPVDLSRSANQGFRDDTADDQKGGWTDQGDNDFRNMPVGRQIFAGVPFVIIDPLDNSGKSCVVLGNRARSYLPTKADGIKVNGHFRRLFFLHTMAWAAPKAGEYRIRYEDGSIETIVMENGKNIADWWSPGDLPQAKLGLTLENPLSQAVGMWVMPWDNPHPEQKIESVDFESYGQAVPILAAISGEKTSLAPVPIGEDTWLTTSEGNGEKPLVSRIGKGDEPGIPRGDSAFRVDMPAAIKGATPAVFARFDKKLANPTHRYLCFWIKALSDGSVSVVLPRKDWKASLKATVALKKAEGWKSAELSIEDDMGLKGKDWDLTALRGELFIFNRGGKTGEAPAVSFLITGIRLE